MGLGPIRITEKQIKRARRHNRNVSDNFSNFNRLLEETILKVAFKIHTSDRFNHILDFNVRRVHIGHCIAYGV